MGWIDFKLPMAAEDSEDAATVSANEEVSLAVVGIDYANADQGKTNRRAEMLLCTPGEVVELHLEPENKHDDRAVAVYSARGIQLGYLTAERCGWVGSKIKSGEECDAIFQEATASAAIIRVRFNDGPPTLPPTLQRQARQFDHREPVDDCDFQPDPDGPEWGA